MIFNKNNYHIISDTFLFDGLKKSDYSSNQSDFACYNYSSNPVNLYRALTFVGGIDEADKNTRYAATPGYDDSSASNLMDN